jgi:hypothetical protein
MDLKDFIKETITSIAKAAVELQAELDGDGVIINPPRAIGRDAASPDLFDPEDSVFRYRQIERVSFDVALTAAEERAARGGGGVQVAIVKVGGEASKNETSERVSRVAFSVSVALPASAPEGANRKRAEERREKSKAAMDRARSSAGRDGWMR